MKLFIKNSIYGLCIAWFTVCVIHARQEEAPKNIEDDGAGVRAKKEEFFYFQFNNEELVDIVHRLAAKKEVNIIFPVKSPLTARITMYIEDPFTLDQAWEKLHTILDLAGYALIEKGSECTIVKADNNITLKEPLPIYISVPPEKIPDSDERIRYIYYLTNLKIGDNFDSTDLSKVLNDMLPDRKNYLADPVSNGLIITDKANNIKAVMDVVTKLDGVTFQETFAVIQLHNTSPSDVNKLFENLLKPATQYKFDTKKQLTESSYFPKNIRTYALPRTNSLIILGNQTAIDRVRDFITKYIDVELESGKSILHIYKLQYMDANDIKGVLKNVLKVDKGGSGQSTEGGKTLINPATQERQFDKIIIETDVPPEGKEAAYYGNNNLIVACRNDDWVRIKSLIEQLDQVQPQVIIEVLIANLTLNDVKSLGAITANPAELNFPKGVNIQSAQIGPSVIVDPVSSTSPAVAVPTSSLAGDLMANVPNATNAAPLTSVLTPGTTVLSIDNGTGGANGTVGDAWSVLATLNLFSYNKVIANPHLIATNNTKAKVMIGQTRLLTDQTVGSGGGTTVVKNKDIPATYTVDIIPRIYTGEIPGGKDDSVNLEVTVDIVDFIPGNADNARLNRTVHTKALLKNGQILALGGLIDHEVSDNFNGTPILANIPILGWLTKFRGTTSIDTNLTIFIAPTIIEPRLRGGLSQYTKDYVNITNKYSQEAELFDSLQDPVTRWYFKRAHDHQQETQDFVNQDEFKRQVNTGQYKSVIDVEQAQSIKEAQALAPVKDSTKRVVLTNLNDKDKSLPDTKDLPDTGATSQKICAVQPTQAPSTPAPTLAVTEKRTTDVKPQQENIAMAKVDVKKLDKNLLKQQLQKILESEDNPLL